MGVSPTPRTYWYLDQESTHILEEAFQRELLDYINNRIVRFRLLIEFSWLWDVQEFVRL